MYYKIGQKVKEGFGERVKSLGLGFSGSQFDFLWEYVEHHLLKQREEIGKEFLLLADDHYWDGLTKDKKLILKHLTYIITLLTQSKGGKV